MKLPWRSYEVETGDGMYRRNRRDIISVPVQETAGVNVPPTASRTVNSDTSIRKSNQTTRPPLRYDPNFPGSSRASAPRGLTQGRARNKRAIVRKNGNGKMEINKYGEMRTQTCMLAFPKDEDEIKRSVPLHGNGTLTFLAPTVHVHCTHTCTCMCDTHSTCSYCVSDVL